MIAPIIHKFTGSNLDCRRGCAEWSNSLWRLPAQTHSDDFMRLRWVVCRMAELPEFLSLTNRQSDDLFCLPFNISLQRGQRPTIFLAESIKEKSSARWEIPWKLNVRTSLRSTKVPASFGSNVYRTMANELCWLRPG